MACNRRIEVKSLKCCTTVIWSSGYFCSQLNQKAAILFATSNITRGRKISLPSVISTHLHILECQHHQFAGVGSAEHWEIQSLIPLFGGWKNRLLSKLGEPCWWTRPLVCSARWNTPPASLAPSYHNGNSTFSKLRERVRVSEKEKERERERERCGYIEWMTEARQSDMIGWQ